MTYNVEYLRAGCRKCSHPRMSWDIALIFFVLGVIYYGWALRRVSLPGIRDGCAGAPGIAGLGCRPSFVHPLWIGAFIPGARRLLQHPSDWDRVRNGPNRIQ